MNKSKKILIVEDEQAYSKVLSLKLEKEGFKVDTAYNGLKALQFLKRGSYDLVVSDLVMPNMNGFDLLHSIMSDYLGIKVVVLSNLSQEIDMQRAKQMGALDFFSKANSSLREIVDRIKGIMSS